MNDVASEAKAHQNLGTSVFDRSEYSQTAKETEKEGKKDTLVQ